MGPFDSFGCRLTSLKMTVVVLAKTKRIDECRCLVGMLVGGVNKSEVDVFGLVGSEADDGAFVFESAHGLRVAVVEVGLRLVEGEDAVGAGGEGLHVKGSIGVGLCVREETGGVGQRNCVGINETQLAL